MKILVFIVFVLLNANSVSAATNQVSDVVYLRQVPTTLSPDRAYLFLRASRAKKGFFTITPVLLRILQSKELDAYRSARRMAYQAELPNLTLKSSDGSVPTINEFKFQYDGPVNAFVLLSGEFIEDGLERSYLLDVSPGEYVLYGSTFGGAGVITCNCLGTVKFNAIPGSITNLGTIYTDKANVSSPLPYIESNLGRSLGNNTFLLGQAVKPADRGDFVSPLLNGLPIVPANYTAVGTFMEPG